jgi:hypothetical protein
MRLELLYAYRNLFRNLFHHEGGCVALGAYMKWSSSCHILNEH